MTDILGTIYGMRGKEEAIMMLTWCDTKVLLKKNTHRIDCVSPRIEMHTSRLQIQKRSPLR
jgi:hypothetical protein